MGWSPFAISISVVLLVFGFGDQAEKPQGVFMGLEPTSQPQMLFPNHISTNMGEYNGLFSPGGESFYYTASLPGYDAIVVMRMLEDGTWSIPEIAPFSGEYPDFDPLFSPNGEQLYFSSRRPLIDNDQSGKSNIWVMEKQGETWAKPIHVPLTQENAYYSSLTLDGKIYFNTRSKRNDSQDIYCATPGPNGYIVKALGKSVNSRASDIDPFVSPDERFLIFRSYRPGGLGGADLYISYRVDGIWQRAQNLGAPINSPSKESCPLVTHDGRLFIFASNRMQQSFYGAGVKSLALVHRKSQNADNGNLNIYYMNTAFIETKP